MSASVDAMIAESEQEYKAAMELAAQLASDGDGEELDNIIVSDVDEDDLKELEALDGDEGLYDLGDDTVLDEAALRELNDDDEPLPAELLALTQNGNASIIKKTVQQSSSITTNATDAAPQSDDQKRVIVAKQAELKDVKMACLQARKAQDLTKARALLQQSKNLEKEIVQLSKQRTSTVTAAPVAAQSTAKQRPTAVVTPKQIQEIVKSRAMEYFDAAKKHKADGNTEECRAAMQVLEQLKVLIKRLSSGGTVPMSDIPPACGQPACGQPVVTEETPLSTDVDATVLQELSVRLSMVIRDARREMKKAYTVGGSESKQAKLNALQFMKFAQEMQKQANLVASWQQQNMTAPVYHWETRTIKTENICEDVETDVLELKIDGIKELQTSHHVYVTYAISIHDAELTGSTTKTKDSVKEYKFNSKHNIYYGQGNKKVTKMTVKNLVRKFKRLKLKLSLMRQRSIFADVVIGECEIKLKPLLDQVILKGSFPFQGKVGGVIDVTLRVRRPIETLDVREYKLPALVIDKPGQVKKIVQPVVQQPVVTTSQPATVNNTAPIASVAVAKPKIVTLPDGISENDVRDPVQVQFYLSSDVMDWEIKRLDSLIVQEQDEDKKAEYDNRKNLVQTQLDILVYKVQNEKLTFEDYLTILKLARDRDEKLISALKQRNKPAAMVKQVEQRLMIMRTEIQGAEDNADELG